MLLSHGPAMVCSHLWDPSMGCVAGWRGAVITSELEKLRSPQSTTPAAPSAALTPMVCTSSSWGQRAAKPGQECPAPSVLNSTFKNFHGSLHDLIPPLEEDPLALSLFEWLLRPSTQRMSCLPIRPLDFSFHSPGTGTSQSSGV